MLLDQMPENFKKILVVVAHPDDETLWFLGGIKSFLQKAEVHIFCLTYTKDSERGRELLEACQNLKVQIFFGGVEDLGIDTCVKNVHPVVKKFLSLNHNYDLVITHPPHGGERPHPHHIQLFHSVRMICESKRFNFGFFSEKPLDPVSSKYIFDFYLMLFKKRPNMQTFVKDFIAALKYYSFKKLSETFHLTEFAIPAEEKQKALSKYPSQIKYLEQYKSYSLEKEYLYFTASRGAKSKPHHDGRAF